MKPIKSFLDYALFVAFFPTILSGPIDRARNFIPQISLHRKLTLDKFYEGCFLILWGLVQKVVIADNIGKLVDPVFSASQPYDGIVILITSYFYVLQLYCDFAGYSNIAIGLGKVLGFDIMINFNFPLFAVNIADFWRRWHISLSTWVRDYIYTPLFLSLRNIKGNKRLSLSLIITMVLLGLWHGAGWTFVVYGLYHGILLAVYQQIQPKISNIVKKKKPINQNISLILRVVFMFHITAIGFLIFRAHSLTQVYEMLYGLIFNFKVSDIFMIKNILERFTLFLIIFLSVGLITFEIVQFRKNDQLIVFRWCTLGRSVFYIVCIYLILFYGVEGGSEFIYAQF
jgi:D-alanyl-lipoteichoic acid acyltransferase DltB (MBOAT superfamily)